MTLPERGFPKAEYHSRLARAQEMMAKSGLAALLLTTEPEIRYFTGFLTRFWESPTRPWFLVVPAAGDPIAVIPTIGSHLMRQTWIKDIRTWQAPDYDDDGVGLLYECLRDCGCGPIGVPDLMESHVRMPLAALRQLAEWLAPREIISDSAIMRQLRMIKSDKEIRKIKAACNIAEAAFAQVAEIAKDGHLLSQVFRSFQCRCLASGADWVPYLAGAVGGGGYADVISPAADTPLKKGDVLMLDTGLVWDGYFCDFDRNFSLGPAAPAIKSAHDRLMDATQAGFDAAKPGALVSDLFDAMNRIVSTGQDGSAVGRMGHGLGMQLTEWPSIVAADHTPLKSGMVLTLEPAVEIAHEKMLVHEEDIVITDDGAVFLSDFQPDQIRVI